MSVIDLTEAEITGPAESWNVRKEWDIMCKKVKKYIQFLFLFLIIIYLFILNVSELILRMSRTLN